MIQIETKDAILLSKNIKLWSEVLEHEIYVY